jgi:hypothetical protein
MTRRALEDGLLRSPQERRALAMTIDGMLLRKEERLRCGFTPNDNSEGSLRGGRSVPDVAICLF